MKLKIIGSKSIIFRYSLTATPLPSKISLAPILTSECFFFLHQICPKKLLKLNFVTLNFFRHKFRCPQTFLRRQFFLPPEFSIIRTTIVRVGPTSGGSQAKRNCVYITLMADKKGWVENKNPFIWRSSPEMEWTLCLPSYEGHGERRRMEEG